jgi:hypothetical protein
VAKDVAANRGAKGGYAGKGTVPMTNEQKIRLLVKKKGTDWVPKNTKSVTIVWSEVTGKHIILIELGVR